jgi:hypothetical protein
MGKVGATEYSYAEAAAPAPLRYSMGLSGFTSKATLAVENFNPTTFLFDTVPTGSASRDQGLGVDLLFQSPRVVALAEGYLRHVEPEGSGAEYTSVGAFAQAGVLVYRRAIDAAVRLSWADVNLLRVEGQTHQTSQRATVQKSTSNDDASDTARRIPWHG